MKTFGQIISQPHVMADIDDPTEHLWEEKDGQWFPARDISKELEQARTHFGGVDDDRQRLILERYSREETSLNEQQIQEFVERCITGDTTYADDEEANYFHYWYFTKYIQTIN